MRLAAAITRATVPLRWTPPRWPRRLRMVVRPARPSALHVAGPTIPSAVRPWLRWKALTARWVPGPKMPSAVMPRARWRSTTAPFLLPPELEAWRGGAERRGRPAPRPAVPAAPRAGWRPEGVAGRSAGGGANARALGP